MSNEISINQKCWNNSFSHFNTYIEKTMKVFHLIFSLALICLVSCELYSQDNLIVQNLTHRIFTKNEINEVIKTARKTCDEEFKSICVGVIEEPGGVIPSVITVHTKEKITEEHTVSYKTIILANKYWKDSTKTSDSLQFEVINKYNDNKWRIILPPDTIHIEIDSTVTYDEAFNLLKIIHEEKYAVTRKNIFRTSPFEMFHNITEVKKSEGGFEIKVYQDGGGQIINCEFRKHQLIITGTRFFVY